MNTLRNSKALAVFSMLAVALAVTIVAAPSAEAGGYGYGWGAHYGASCYTPIHYTTPVYPTYKYVAPPCHTTYYTPTYYGHGCHYPW